MHSKLVSMSNLRFHFATLVPLTHPELLIRVHGEDAEMEYLIGKRAFVMLECRLRWLAEHLTGNRAFAILGCRLRWLVEHLTGNRAFATLGNRVRLLAAMLDQFILQFYFTTPMCLMHAFVTTNASSRVK